MEYNICFTVCICIIYKNNFLSISRHRLSQIAISFLLVHLFFLIFLFEVYQESLDPSHMYFSLFYELRFPRFGSESQR